MFGGYFKVSPVEAQIKLKNGETIVKKLAVKRIRDTAKTSPSKIH